MRLSMGHDAPEDCDEDEDAEAGALVEAEDACDVTSIRDMIRDYLKAMAAAPRAS